MEQLLKGAVSTEHRKAAKQLLYLLVVVPVVCFGHLGHIAAANL